MRVAHDGARGIPWGEQLQAICLALSARASYEAASRDGVHFIVSILHPCVAFWSDAFMCIHEHFLCCIQLHLILGALKIGCVLIVWCIVVHSFDARCTWCILKHYRMYAFCTWCISAFTCMWIRCILMHSNYDAFMCITVCMHSKRDPHGYQWSPLPPECAYGRRFPQRRFRAGATGAGLDTNGSARRQCLCMHTNASWCVRMRLNAFVCTLYYVCIHMRHDAHGIVHRKPTSLVTMLVTSDFIVNPIIGQLA